MFLFAILYLDKGCHCLFFHIVKIKPLHCWHKLLPPMDAWKQISPLSWTLLLVYVGCAKVTFVADSLSTGHDFSLLYMLASTTSCHEVTKALCTRSSVMLSRVLRPVAGGKKNNKAKTMMPITISNFILLTNFFPLVFSFL